MPQAPYMETVLRRDRIVVLVGLICITVLAWAYISYLAWDMEQVDMEMAMPQTLTWGFPDFILMFVMWAVMMVAMMVPSASPMILLFANVCRLTCNLHG